MVIYQLKCYALRHGNFPDKLKYADVTPVFRKDDPKKAKNYRPLSILLRVFKIFLKD